jgi:hypothetical protein
VPESDILKKPLDCGRLIPVGVDDEDPRRESVALLAIELVSLRTGNVRGVLESAGAGISGTSHAVDVVESGVPSSMVDMDVSLVSPEPKAS